MDELPMHPIVLAFGTARNDPGCVLYPRDHRHNTKHLLDRLRAVFAKTRLGAMPRAARLSRRGEATAACTQIRAGAAFAHSIKSLDVMEDDAAG